MAVAIPAILYLLYVNHYSVDVPNADDWDMIGLVASALHGHLAMAALWSQYVAGRPLVTRLVVVGFGVFDHLDEKSIALFSALTFIASFAVLLFPFRAYLGRRLTFWPVFTLGIVWFSLADVENALWAIQLVAFLVVFFFAVMAYVLLVPRRNRNVFFALGIVAAVAASLSFLQGFVVWPVGLLCLLWSRPWGRRTYCESAIWISAAVATVVIYAHGYIAGNSACLAEGGRPGACSLTYGVLHPIKLARYLLVLVGNVVPTSIQSLQPRYLVAYELLGAGICVVAGFVVVQSVRERRGRASPLPVVLIAFAVFFDLMIALGHLGEGILSAGIDRFTLPNTILLVGILMYAWAHAPNVRTRAQWVGRRERFRVLGFSTLILLLVLQCVAVTRFGIAKGGELRAQNVTLARVVVNLNRIPPGRRACYFESTVVGPPLFDLEIWRDMAKENHLSVFQPRTARVYRAQGPPTIARCQQTPYVTTAALPPGTVGRPYSAPLSATGGRPPFVWSLATGLGFLPKGLKLDPSSGIISGTPKAAGSYTFSVTVDEGATSIQTKDAQTNYPDGLSIAIS